MQAPTSSHRDAIEAVAAALDVYVSPFTNTANRFTTIQIDDLKLLGAKPKTIYKAMLSDWGRRRSKKVLILNWYEDRLADAKNKPVEFLRSVVIIFILKLRIKNIIWVRHNYRAHNLIGWERLNKLYIKIIGLCASASVTLRPVKQFSSMVAPHPLYSEGLASTPNAEAGRDIDYLVVGTIRKNRGLDRLLQRWPEDLRLKISGRCKDEQLKSQLEAIIAERNLQVEWNDKFLDDAELDGLIARARFVVIPGTDNTAIVSGLLYHGASFGANILMTDGEFFRFSKAQFSFVNELGQLGSGAPPPYVAPDRVLAEITAVNGQNERLRAWSTIFQRLLDPA